MPNSERTLEDLKKDYFFFEKKYSLPSFEELNKEFGIEELADVETDFLLRTIRKYIVEKLAFSSKFVEVLLNPSEGGGSLFVFSIVKNLKQEEKKILVEIYEKLSKIHLEAIKRDVLYSEKEEADFVKRIFSFWEESKKKIFEVVEVIESNWDNKTGKSEKSYFR